MIPPRSALSLKDTIGFLLHVLVKMAKGKEWGQLTITVQNGQIVFVEEKYSHRDRLPGAVVSPEELRSRLAAVAG